MQNTRYEVIGTRFQVIQNTVSIGVKYSWFVSRLTFHVSRLYFFVVPLPICAYYRTKGSFNYNIGPSIETLCVKPIGKTNENTSWQLAVRQQAVNTKYKLSAIRCHLNKKIFLRSYLYSFSTTYFVLCILYFLAVLQLAVYLVLEIWFLYFCVLVFWFLYFSCISSAFTFYI